MKEYFDFINCYSAEDDYLVLDDITGNLQFVYVLSSGEKFWNEIKKYNGEQFRKIFGRLGWDAKEGEKPTTKLLRSFVIAVLGRLEDEHIVQEAQKRFERFLEDPDSLSPDIRSAVYNIVAWNGNEKTQEMFKDLYRKATTQESKLRFLAAVSSCKDKKLLSNALDYSLSEEVRLQDMVLPIVRVAWNPYGRTLVWPWLKKNWKEIREKLKGMGIPLLKRIIESLASTPDGKNEEEIRSFFKKNYVPGMDMSLAQTLERMKIRAKFIQKMREDFAS